MSHLVQNLGRPQSTVYGLNGHRSDYIISLFKVTYKPTIQISHNFHALFYQDLREFRYLRLMRASVSSTLGPMKPQSALEQRTGLNECRQSGEAFDRGFNQTPLAKHAFFSGSLVAEVSSLCISSVCLKTLDFPQPNREAGRCKKLVRKEVVEVPCRFMFFLVVWKRSWTASGHAEMRTFAIKEVVGIHVLLTRSFFANGILRRLVPTVSSARSTSALLRF